MAMVPVKLLKDRRGDRAGGVITVPKDLADELIRQGVGKAHAPAAKPAPAEEQPSAIERARKQADDAQRETEKEADRADRAESANSKLREELAALKAAKAQDAKAQDPKK